MRYLFTFIVLFLLFLTVKAQTSNDSANMAPYLKTRIVPGFKLLKMDSTYFYKYQLKKNTATVIVYFNPDCDHCQHEAKAMVDSVKFLKKVQVVFISSAPFAEIKKFAEDYKLNYLPYSIVGRDEQYYVTRYFRVNYTPYVALYDKKGQLIQTFEGGTSVANISRLVK